GGGGALRLAEDLACPLRQLLDGLAFLRLGRTQRVAAAASCERRLLRLAKRGAGGEERANAALVALGQLVDRPHRDRRLREPANRLGALRVPVPLQPSAQLLA